MREMLSANAWLSGNGLRDQVDGGANWRIVGDLVVHRRLDVRFGDKLPPQPGGQRYRATVRDLADTGRDPEPRERSDLVLKAAREDARETCEVGRNVQRETVRRDATGHTHADRSYLRGATVRQVDPHAGLPTLCARGDAVARERVPHCVLDRAHVPDEIVPLDEPDDRIANELPRAVVGDVATAIDAVHSRACRPKDVRSDEQVIRR